MMMMMVGGGVISTDVDDDGLAQIFRIKKNWVQRCKGHFFSLTT